MRLSLITPPATEPITVDQVKSAARVSGAAFDTQIPLMIAAARQSAETLLQRRLITQELELVLPYFPCSATLPLTLPDVSEVVSLKYLDAAHALQTFATGSYGLDAESVPSEVYLVGDAWPTTYASNAAVRVRFKAGYGATADKVPESIRMWILLHVVQLIQSPDGLKDGALTPLPQLDGLLDGHKVWSHA